ncbi:MAG: HD domain-containing phosphohydrolase [Pseudomonadota bacterium]
MSLHDVNGQMVDTPDENPHYIRAVTAVGDAQQLVAEQDIYASNGMKLIAKGAPINSHQFERLTKHKLSLPLDQLVVASNPVDGTALALDMDKVLEDDARYRQIAARTGDPRALKQSLGNLRLQGPILLRLTVLRERFPDIYRHSVRTAMIAYAIGQRLSLPARDIDHLLLAALCHDMGEMHTDPALLASEHSITPSERRYVHVHPVTAFVLLRELPGITPAAAQAVLHHHERLDGSGYPGDLPGARIARLARIIGVADVAEAVMKRFDMARLDMLFRLNRARFDADIVGALRDLVSMKHMDGSGTPEIDDTAAQLNRLAGLLQAWFAVRDTLEAPASGCAHATFLFERMGAIRSMVLQAGFNPDNMASMLAVAKEDPAIMRELSGMLDEMDWLMQDLANEIDRRSPELAGLSQGALKGLLGQLRPAEDVLPHDASVARQTAC